MFEGKTALVTGASRGIGKAIAMSFAKNGANVVINYHKSKDSAVKAVKEAEEYGAEAIAVKADVSDFDEIKKMADRIKSDFNKVDILVNNAAIIKDRSVSNMSLEEWHSVIRTNLDGIFNVTKNVLALMPDGGRIINISSIAGIYGNAGQCNYAASKAAIIGFTKSLAKELGSRKITVNAIAPGLVNTYGLRECASGSKLEKIKEKIVLRYIAQAEEIANIALFLSSKQAKFITGSVIMADGGLVL